MAVQRLVSSQFAAGASLSLCALVICTAVACTAQTEAPPARSIVRLTSGVRVAGFYPLSSALARAYEQALPELRVELQESTGSVRNAQALQRGEADLGLVFADVAYVSYMGALDEEPVAFDQLRGIAVLQGTVLHVAVRAGLAIDDIGQLRGRRVAIGPSGSGTALSSRIALRGYGIELDEVSAETLPFNEAAWRLAQGTLDAAFVTAGYPAESVTLALESGASLLHIDGPAVDRMRSEYPFLRLVFVPDGTYPGQNGLIRTIGVENLLVCRSDLPEEVVYELTRGLFDMLSGLSAERASLRLMDLEQAPATPIPLHPGAARYYREREIAR